MSILSSQEKAKIIRKTKKEYYYFQELLTIHKCEPDFVSWCKKQMNNCVERLQTLGYYELVKV